MYCVTHNAIEQAKLEQGSDLFQIVKTLRMQRPGGIPSQVRNNNNYHHNYYLYYRNAMKLFTSLSASF